MLTSFSKDNDMLANELSHYIELPIPPAAATLIVGELGLPSFRSSFVTAWYAKAHWSTMSVPFALRCDANGNWSTLVSMDRAADLHQCLDHIMPDFIEIMEVRGRNARAA